MAPSRRHVNGDVLDLPLFYLLEFFCGGAGVGGHVEARVVHVRARI